VKSYHSTTVETAATTIERRDMTPGRTVISNSGGAARR
jgi:hypothetical protein